MLKKLLTFNLILFLSTSFLTKFRCCSYIGISELSFTIIEVTILLLILKENKWKIFPKEDLIFLYVSIVFFLSIIPTFILYREIQIHKPIYYISYLLITLTPISTFILIKVLKINFRFIFSVSFVIINILILISLFMPSSFYLGIRFESFSTNPNQFAEFLASYILFSVLFFKRKTIKFISFLILSLYSLLSLSDAFKLGLLMGFIFTGFIYLYKKLNQFIFNITIVYLVIILIIFIKLNYSIIVEFIINELIYKMDTNASRLHIYPNAIDAVFYNFYTLFTGLGIGIFSGLSKPWEGVEPHNTLLAILDQFGLLNAIVYILILVKILELIIKREKYFICLAFFIELSTTFFHNMERHFLFWFTLFVLYFYLKYENIFNTEFSRWRSRKTI